MKKHLLLASAILILLVNCRSPEPDHLSSFQIYIDSLTILPKIDSFAFSIPIDREIRVKEYFEFMDSLARKFTGAVPYPLSEHALVRANPWIICTLEETDYYRLMARDSFVYNQKEMIVLKPGDSLRVPNAYYAALLAEKFRSTWIDVNIPEYKLRIVEGTDTLYTFPVRVGRDERRYLAMAGREISLRTDTGVGHIFRINKTPVFINPRDGRIYNVTRRDDGKTTACPQTPWLDPELNGQRPGCMIHPTTNPNTLGKSYSNGCVGTREGDAWRIYYHAPLNTRVVFRYDLEVIAENGDTIQLKDIYRLRKK